MPCEDCAGVRVELLALKEYMAQWFGLILKQVNSAENKAAEFRVSVSKQLNKQDECLQTLAIRSEKVADPETDNRKKDKKISGNNGAAVGHIWPSSTQQAVAAVCSPTVVTFPTFSVNSSSDIRSTREDTSVFDSLRKSGYVKFEEKDDDIQELTPSSVENMGFSEQRTCFEPNACVSLSVQRNSASHSLNSTYLPAISVESVSGTTNIELPEKQNTADDDLRILHPESPCGFTTADGLLVKRRRRNCPYRWKKPKVSGRLTVAPKRSSQPSGSGSVSRPNSNVNYYECRICHVKIRSVEYLPKHAGIHLGIKPFQCNYCSYKTLRKDNIRVHMKVKHKAPDDEQPQVLMDELDYKELLRRKVRDCFEFESS